MLPEDLKNYRAPTGHWHGIIALAVVVAGLGIVGPIDFAYQLELEAQNKVMRAELAAKRRPQAQVAPVRPACRDPNKQQFHAWQSDGARWHARCRDGYIFVKTGA